MSAPLYHLHHVQKTLKLIQFISYVTNRLIVKILDIV